jgi:hypothetical protein
MLLATPIALYAETHFRFFPHMPSFLYRPFPEIIFDLPARIAPGKDIPVLLMANDINDYHIDIKAVTLVASQNEKSFEIFNTSTPDQYSVKHPFEKQCSVYLFRIDRNLVNSGDLLINCKVTATKNGRPFVVLNDNLRTSSKIGLKTHLATEPLPGLSHCAYGDLHVHSQYSRSHVEFGPPISVIDTMASACGMSFICITDHSFDLACSMDDFLKEDAGLSRWKSFNECISKQDSFKTCIIPGEEISVLNSHGKTVHLCAMNISEFIHGSSDGARKKITEKMDLTIPEALESISAQNGIAFAAHPGASTTFLQSLLLNRGNWSKNDLHDGLMGYQAANSDFSKSWVRAKKLWIDALLKGKRLALLAGSDAHGDFNRNRSIGFPFLFIHELFNRYFSFLKTGCYINTVSQKSVLEAIRNNLTFVTSGPFLSICYGDTTEPCAIDCQGKKNIGDSLSIVAESSYEFGKPAALHIYAGKIGDCSEQLLASEKIVTNSFSYKMVIKKNRLNPYSYIRAELICRQQDGTLHNAATSPCYLTQ